MEQDVNIKASVFKSPLVYGLAGGQVALVLLALVGVVQRPTVAWYQLLVMGASGLTTVMVLSLFAPPAVRTPMRQFVQVIFEGRVRSRIFVIGLILISIVCAVSIFTPAYTSGSLPALWSFFPFILFWPLVTIWLLTTITDPARHGARQFSINTAVTFVSFIVFAVLLEGVLQLMFPRLPSVITSRMPQAARYSGIQFETAYGARQYPGFQEVDFMVDERYGDIVPPYCPHPDDAETEPPYRVHYVRDAYGFRNPADWPDQPDVLVVGDSFVDGENVQTPFWEGITPSVLGLGLPGTGNVEQLLALQEFGIPQKPDVVVMAYFEGNDLLDNMRFEAAHREGKNFYDYVVSHTPRMQFMVTYHLARWLSAPVRSNACPETRMMPAGYPMVFDHDYVSILTISKDDLLESKAFELTRQSILDAEALARTNGATLVLAYIPVRAQVYWDDLIAAGELSRMGKNADPVELRPTGYYYNVRASDEETVDRLARNYGAQREVISELAEQNGIHFLDFTPDFQAAAAEGERLYLYGDTHWSQRGHDLAHRVLKDFLQDQGLISGGLSG